MVHRSQMRLISLDELTYISSTFKNDLNLEENKNVIENEKKNY